MVLFFGLCKEWLIQNRTSQTVRKSAIFLDFLGLNIELTGNVYKILMGNKSSVRLTNNTYFVNLRASQHSPFWKRSHERTLKCVLGVRIGAQFAATMVVPIPVLYLKSQREYDS